MVILLDNTQPSLHTPPHSPPLPLYCLGIRCPCTARAARSVTDTGGRAAERLAHQDVLNTTAGIAVKGDEGVLVVSAGKNASLAGATLAALGKNGSVLLSAGENISLDTKKLQSEKDMAENAENYLRTKRGTELAAEIRADGNISIAAGNDLTARAADITSKNGTTSLSAGNDISLTAGREISEDHYGIRYKESGLLSSKTTTIRIDTESDIARTTNITGQNVNIAAKRDATFAAANIAADNDVNIAAGRNVSITSAENYSHTENYKEVKKSGIFGSGGGLGFTIGTQQTKTTRDSDAITQQGTNIAALGGSVTISAGENAHISSGNILADKDATITAKETSIDGKYNIYRESITQESKTTGLTVSLSHGLLDLGQSLYTPISRIGEVQDDRLKAVYALRTGRMMHDAFKKNPLTGQTFSLNVSFGTSKSYSRMEAATTEYAGSRIASGGNTNITAGERDLTVKGSAVTGSDVSLTAKGNVRLESGENTNITTTTNKFSSASIGASFSPQGLSDISINANKGNGSSKETVTSYSPTIVAAENNLSLTSGKDMDIIGSKAQGDRITARVGRNLNIETLQEKETYEEQNKSTGFGFSWSMNPITKHFSKPTIGRDWSKGTIDSHYRSAHDQAGFFAGSKGFDIYVEKNTDLKGGVIASKASPDKNHLSTGTFSFSNLKNEAEYNAKDTGSSAQIKPTLRLTKEEDPDGNKKERLKVVQSLHSTPSIPIVVQGDASSTTKSAIAPGTIDIRENPSQDISALSRDTANSLNELGRIFDKKTIEEQQELVSVFREEAFRLLHNLPDDGSGRKAFLHSLVGGLISQFAGAGFASGATGAGLNEALINNLKGLDPTIAQIASGVLGAAAAKIVNGDATAGAIAAASGTKHNFFGGTAAGSITPQMMASLTGYVVIIYEGTQYIQKAATNEIIAKLQQDGSWLFNEIDSALESVFKEHNIPYSQPQTLNGPHYYITPSITVTSPDHEHFPFDLSPNILDLKYKPYTNPLFDFKEQWSSQDFSDGNRFFSKGVEKEKADKAYPPADEHSSTNNPIKRTGKPNSSIDRVDEKGRIITRRWYDGNGRAKKDVDFTDHGNPKTHPQVPHEHTWEWDKNGHSNRK